MSILEWMDEIAHQGWFRLIDFTFHIVIFWHVIAHICRAGKRLHQYVHRPLHRLLVRVAPRLALRLYRYRADARFARDNAYMEHS